MSNPMLNRLMTQERVLTSEPMTIGGTVNKTLVLTVLAFLSAFYVWDAYAAGLTDKVGGLMVMGLIGGLVTCLLGIFVKSITKIMAPMYALFQGLVLGGLSATFEAQYPGIVIQAISGTMMALLVMLIMFKANIIRATDKFRSTIFVATGSIMGIYLVQFIGSFFGKSIPHIFAVGPVGIAFSAIVVLIAAFNLIVDFEIIEQGAKNFLPKDFEWYCSLSLMITLLWLYLEILRLLAKLNSRD